MKTMAIHAEAVDILVRKGRFEPEVAIGVAEAIEVSINLTQLVTVPILDSRLQDLRHEIKADIQSLRLEFKSDLSSEIGKVYSTLASELAKVHASIAQTNTNLAEGLGKLSTETHTAIQKVHTDIEKMHTEFQKVNANLMRWILLTMMGSVAVSMAAKSLLGMLSN